MNVFLRLKPDVRLNLGFLFLAGLGFWLSMTSLLPVLPAYIQDMGGSDQQVGLVMGCFALGLLLSRAQLGKMADEQGRKQVVLIGAAVVAIAPIGYVFIHSIPGMMAWRTFHGLSIAAFTTGYSALVVDLAPEKNRGEIIGYMSLVIPLGMSIGPILGGYLQETAGYATVFWVAAICGCMALFFANRTQEKSSHVIQDAPNSKAHKDVRALETRRDFRQLVLDKGLYIPAMIMLCIGLVFGTLVTYLPLYIRQLEIDFNTGLFYGAAAISSFSIRIFVGRASDTLGRGLFISFSLLCYIATMLLLSQAITPSLFLGAGIVEGIGAGILVPMMIALMSDRSFSHERGKVYSICIGGFDVGIAIAGLIFGTLAQQLGYQDVFVIAAGLAFCAFLLFITQVNPHLKSSLKFALGRTGDRYAQKLSS